MHLLARYGDPRALLRLGPARLAQFLIRHSHGQWRHDKADQALMLTAQVRRLDECIAGLYAAVDPAQIARTAPGVGPVLAAAITARLGDPHRFTSLAAIRSYSGLVPNHDEKMFRVVKDRAGWFDIVMGRATGTDENATDGEEDRVPLHPRISEALSMDLTSR